ncbi:MAG: hypothetical protein OXC95_14010, partial [Dehalococcoidia bacterium]|nr:hypothetical protein [Dehalococcoidia bacterium]
MEIGAVFAGLKKMRFSTAFVSAMCLSFILGVLWLHGNAGQVHACKCAIPGSPTDELEKSDAVFAGAVVSIRHSFDPDEGPYSPEDRTTVRFDVSAVWKGAVHEDTNITTPPTGGSCGFPFNEGEEYIVYAFDSAYEGDGYTAGRCSPTAP